MKRVKKQAKFIFTETYIDDVDHAWEISVELILDYQERTMTIKSNKSGGETFIFIRGKVNTFQKWNAIMSAMQQAAEFGYNELRKAIDKEG